MKEGGPVLRNSNKNSEADMTEDEGHYNYVIPQEEKNFGRHTRHNTRFITHPYSQQNIIQPLDTNVHTELNQIQLSQSQHMQNFATINQQSLIQNQDNQNIKGVSILSTRLKNDKNQTTQSSQDANTEGTEPEPIINTEEAKIPEAIRLPENLENLPKADEFPTKRSRWNTNEEILALLLNFSKHEEWQSKDVVIRPESGSMLMYSRKKVRYRRDGYCWKKRKDGKTTREDHMKLKVQGVECIYGCYVHSAVLPTFHRRCYWLLQNPDIVLVHYLNVPYPDDSKLAALIPNIAFWTEKKEWTREELLLQLKPMYENPGLESGKDGENEESKLNRINQVSSFIESMIAQLLEKQRYVRTALVNSLECGCGNRKCLGASRCSRPIRRISSAKKQGKRASVNAKSQEKRSANNNERNILKTTAVRKLSGLKVENRSCNQTSNSAFYSPQSQHNESEPLQSQLQQLLAQPQQTPNVNLMPTVNSKDILTNYSRTDMRVESYLSNAEFANGESQHYQTYSCQLTADQYRPNNEMADEKQEINLTENVSNSNLNIIPYQNEDSEYTTDKYQSDTTDGSDCNSYSTIHHQASPNDSFTSVEDTEAYPNGDILDDLIMNVNQCYNYENGDYNADKSLYELIIQLSQKDKKSSSTNPLLSYEKLQQYGLHSENIDTCSPMFESNTQPVSDANGNFLNSCSRYSTAGAEENANNLNNIMPNDFPRIEENHMENYSTEIDINFMNTPEFNSSERSASNPSLQDSRQTDSPCAIIDLAPEWSYCEGGTKLLIVGPWYFQSDYSVLFDSYSVPATLIQAGVLKCYCPEHAVGLVSLQVVSGGSIISNSVIFEYKKRPNYEESNCHNLCNIKSEHYNQYMYENDTLLKFILIQRIEAIQDDAFMHSSSLINKYEEVREKTTM